MPTTIPNQKETVIPFPYSGDYRVDVLLDSLTARWNVKEKPGTSTTVTFSFMSQAPSYADEEDQTGFQVFNETQKVATRQILEQISQQIGIDFVEVNDTATNFGQLRFGNNSQGKVSAGYAYQPGLSDTAGDLYINADSATAMNNLVPGSFSWSTLVHEIGHTLGLKHPGNYNAGETSTPVVENLLASTEDSVRNTIMSYVEVPQGQERAFFGKYDMLALRFLYGGRSYHANDDVYRFTDADGNKLILINDSGGIDTIDVSGITQGKVTSIDVKTGAILRQEGVNISLVAGTDSSIGWVGGFSSNGGTSTSGRADQNISIDYASLIENVIGSRYDDIIVGNQLDNRIEGGLGADTIDGGLGTDTTVFAGNRNDYSLMGLSISSRLDMSIKNNNIVSDRDVTIGVERYEFRDMRIDLTVGDTARAVGATAVKNIAELYIAYFNRIPDSEGMNYWLQQFKSGVSIETIGKSFYAAAISPTFSALTGYSSSMSNVDFIRTIYKNVLGRSEVDQGGLDYWNNALSKPEGSVGAETRGTLINTILNAAHGFKNDATYGWVANLLDNKFTVANYFAIEQGISYLAPEENYQRGVAIAAAVTAIDTKAAISLIGVTDLGFTT